VTTDVREQLQASLGAAYTIERELDGGGMARVFVAKEMALGRDVAVKVLPPELSSAVSAERFRREMQLAARLQHPHIVPVLASGEAGGLLYYTMPFVEGESLRARLAGAGALPVPAAVAILRELADALAYAHERGVVHRDIKPENVLLSGEHALVTDFGIARALRASTGPAALTATGVALGTPNYMAPEQVAADPDVDHRADLYAWGCVAYEMLAGAAPFSGRPSQAVFAAHIAEAPEPLARRRRGVPAALESLVMRCLAKLPADRPQSAAEVRRALEAIAATNDQGRLASAPFQRIRAVPSGVLRALAALAILGAVVAALARRHPPPASAGDRGVVAVVPFRVSGSDPSLAYLREGMIDLLSAKLNGEGGPRATNPRTVVSAWRRMTSAGTAELSPEQTLQLAARLGAGQVLLGEIVGTPRQLVVNASLYEVPGGRVRAQASVVGTVDSLPALVDGLTARLLSLQAGEGERRLEYLTTTSLPALRAYLDGQAAYRRGRYQESVAHFTRALDLDSTFALAGLGLASSAGWLSTVNPSVANRGTAAAWAFRARLSERDKALLVARVGPEYPAPSSRRAILAARERLVEHGPDSPDAWYETGDVLYHWGRALGLSAPEERAEAAFHRALDLDSAFSAPLQHLLELAARRGDTTTVRRLGAIAIGADSAGEIADYLRWRTAISLGDSLALAALRSRFASMTSTSLDFIGGVSVFDGVAVEDSDRALAELSRRAGTSTARFWSHFRGHAHAMNRGRPGAGRRLLDAAALETQPLPRHHLRQQVRDALYWGGDSTAASAAVGVLAQHAGAEWAGGAAERAAQYHDLCVSEQWRLWHGDVRTGDRAIARLAEASAPDDAAGLVSANRACATLLGALLAAGARRRDASAKLDRLDSLMQTVPAPAIHPETMADYGNLVVARLRERGGNRHGALAAARRRRYFMDWPLYLSTFLLEEGRLAALTGDREGAIRAYRHYLALRSDAELPARAEVEEARARVAALERGR
jgi:serine/threonine-protein kinase